MIDYILVHCQKDC